MTDVGTRLKDADPLAHEPGLSAADAEQVRHVTLGEIRWHAARRRAAWRPLAVAATVMLAGVATIAMKQWWSGAPGAASVRQDDRLSVASRPDGTRQQLQFATPGGTRVIWVFDPAFQQ